MMANVKPPNTIRFAWWAAEEAGLLGSAAYVAGLSPAERDHIALYMNYDMVGSPNGILMVYDANESTFPAPVGVPPGARRRSRTSTSRTTPRSASRTTTPSSPGAATTRPSSTGIPSGGLFTGAEVRRPRSRQAIWGGTAGEQFDPCYHQACDTFGTTTTSSSRSTAT